MIEVVGFGVRWERRAKRRTVKGSTNWSDWEYFSGLHYLEHQLWCYY